MQDNNNKTRTEAPKLQPTVYLSGNSLRVLSEKLLPPR